MKEPKYNPLEQDAFTFYRGVKVTTSKFQKDQQSYKDEIDDLLRKSGIDYYEGHHPKPVQQDEQ